MFNCFKTKSKVSVEVWDLMDSDGDNVVSTHELNVVAPYFHDAAIKDLENTLGILKATPAVQHVLQIAGRKDKLFIKDFKRLQYNLPVSVWKQQVLPALRQAEVNRLLGTR